MQEYTLSELNKIIRQRLEENLDPSYWVIAEIGEMRVNQKGHCYLELVEKSDEEVLAKMKATIWSYAYRNINGWFEAITGEQLRPGLKILCNVEVQFHEVYGMSFNIRDINPNFTLGERAKQRAAILKQLEIEGVIDMNRDLSLPLVPQKIALISSPTAAGYQDFMEQLLHNDFGYKFDVELFPAIMQGEEASRSMIQSLIAIHKEIERFDVVAIIRGGGAALDLDCFDTYDLATHVSQFPIPVITGIGHERDETIVDRVANTKMKTPTAAAEFLIYGLNGFESRIDTLFEFIENYTQEIISVTGLKLDNYRERIKGLSAIKMGQYHYALDKHRHSLTYNTKIVIQHHSAKLEQITDRIINLPSSYLKLEFEKINHMEEKITLLDPVHCMKRGFSITQQEGRTLKSIKALNKRLPIVTNLADGSFTSKYEK